MADYITFAVRGLVLVAVKLKLQYCMVLFVCFVFVVCLTGCLLSKLCVYVRLIVFEEKMWLIISLLLSEV